MNERNKKEIKLLYILYFLMFGIILYLHSIQLLGVKDDAWFYEKSQEGILTLLHQRYILWTSRLVIEFVMLIMLNLPAVVWIVLDSLMFMLIINSIRYLCKSEDIGLQIIQVLIIFFCIALIPIAYYGEAGWYATTFNYVWPLGLGLYVLTKVDAVFHNKKLSIFEYIASILALFYAANQEQMSALLLGFCILYCIIYVYHNKRIPIYMVAVLLLIIGMFLFQMTCPGNVNRVASETQKFYIEYESFNLIDKIAAGIVTMSYYVFVWNGITLTFFISILLAVIKNRKHILDIVLALIPVICTGILMLGEGIIHKIPIFNHIFRVLMTWRHVYTGYRDVRFILTILYIVFMFGLTLYLLWKYCKTDMFKIVIIVGAGICAKVIIGFSPTIFVSGARTTLYTNYCFIAAILLIIKATYDRRHLW